MVRLGGIDELIAQVRADADRNWRFPVRVLLVEGLDAWREVVEHLGLEVDEILQISSFCGAGDFYPSAISIEDNLKRSNARKVLVLPWAEWLRLQTGQEIQDAFNIDAFKLLLSLAQWEKMGKKRIYIPLFESRETVNELQKRLARYPAREITPIWRVSKGGSVKVTILPLEPEHTPGPMLKKGIKAYLECWEQGGMEELVLVTQWARWLKGRKASFTVEVYSGAYQVLAGKIGSWSESVTENWGREKEWAWLLLESRQGETFGELAARILNVKEYQAEQLFSRWEKFSRQEQWLVWLWSKLELPGTGYVGRALQRTTNVEHFIKALVYGILDKVPAVEEVRERKSFLATVGVRELPAAFLEAVTELPDPLHRLACLLGVAENEKILATTAVKELLDEGRHEEEWWIYLEAVCPELAWYLTVPPLPEAQLQEYFGLYVRSRLVDTAKPQLLDLARKIAGEQSLWQYRSRDQLLEELGSRESMRVVWVDGMGVEWLGVLLQALHKERELVADFNLARANLPSITDTNKGWQTEEEVERAVDQEGHKVPYRHPHVLIKQMDVICDVARRAAGFLGTAREVIITSDHGLTRFAKTSGTIQLPDGSRVHKWGRCATLPPGLPPEVLCQSDCLYQGNSVILFTHEKCCGQAGISGQVHGGATPEEWLVPVVRVRKPFRPFKPEFLDVHVLTPKVQLNIRGEGELQVDITGYEGDMVQLRIRQHIFTGQRKADTVWFFGLRGLEGGQHYGILEGDVGKLCKIQFITVKGLIEDTFGL